MDGTVPKFLIEDGIDMPNADHERGRKPSYPFAQMSVGQSFLVPTDGSAKHNIRVINNVGHCARSWSERHSQSAKFRTRRVDGGIRCWRVA